MSKMPQLENVVKGLKRSSAGPKRTWLPITPEILHQLKGVWLARQNQKDASMLWATVTMCFCGFLRSGEVVVPPQTGYDPAAHLSFGDVQTTNTQCIEIRIKALKTDPFWMGVSVYLGRTDNDLCPVAVSLDYMVRRGTTVGPFFTFSDGS